ncbi:unnamed protein product [Darwinula stevensoni]|uniref:Major facilitator superfamily (MFS) profile domain-containing protein n=1 Tax=Darwinula stevensoni TaxID=69355 RepID=A0A7R9A438_9CRUS|nr:unnamed protein product [Darwinula stevensoni]CAG0882594.1 unnamed protein product [Darwinula stevensoni]
MSNTDGQIKRGVLVIFFSLVLDLLAFTVILPLFPSLFDHYEKHDTGTLYSSMKASVQTFQQALGVPDNFNSVLFGGLIGSLFSFLQFLSSPLVGGLSDIYGRKPLLLITMVGILASYALWAAADSFAVFILARIIGGLSKGNISLSTAIVSDLSSEKTRGKAMALIGVAFSIGFTLGPVIGAAFVVWSKGTSNWFIYPAWFAIILMVLDIIYVVYFFEESLPLEKRSGSVTGSLGQAAHFINPSSLFAFHLVKDLKAEEWRNLKRIGMIYFLYLLFFSGLEFTLTFLTHIHFSFDSMRQGRMYAFIGITMALLQGVFGLMSMVPAFFIIGLATTTAWLYFGLFFFSAGSAIVVPCLTTLVSGYGGERQRGLVLGTFRSLGALARAIGPLVASLVYWSVGPALCYVLGAVLLIIPFKMMQKTNIPNQL